MLYKGKNVEFIQLVSYLGEKYEDATFRKNEMFFKKKISGKLSFPCSFECPIEDMICINHKGTPGVGDTDKDRNALLCGLKELKEIFPNSFINLHLDKSIENEGNSVDLTEEEFKELYPMS